MINETRTIDAMGTGKMGGSPRPKEQQMDQCIAITNAPGLSLPDARVGRKPSLDENDSLVAEAAHDLRNPLTVITGVTYNLKRGLKRDEKLDRTQMAQGLEIIDAMAARMNALIGQLVEATRMPSARAFALHREPVNLAALTIECVTRQEMLDTSRRISIDAPQPVWGRWDRALLERVLGNILSNAMKYSPKGTAVLVTMHRDDTATESWAILTVTDHGLGIPPQDLPSVFDAFYRSQRVTDSVPGTGLGLAIVRRIVDQHGGQVAITSEEGRGTSIVIRLPIGDE